ncbi:hypothetical protein [[Kitasatospora] papulosa]|uniref:hypothetical protein n=1 Tax=[Kitasatospora] papulosa TaxID=1464011 RepID=UPI0036E1D827
MRALAMMMEPARAALRSRSPVCRRLAGRTSQPGGDEPTDHGPYPRAGGGFTIRGQIAGLARDDQDGTEFLRRAGLPDTDELLDQPEWVEWQGGRAHTYAAA